MSTRLRNQIVPNGRKGLNVRLVQVAAAISNRLDALNHRVAKLESELPPSFKNAASRRRMTTHTLPQHTVETDLPPGSILRDRLKADGRHCWALIGRTKTVLRYCLAAL